MTTPAGWYDDGAGRKRWWDGARWTDHVHMVSAPGGSGSHLWWALSPVYSCFTIAFIPAVHAAIKLRRRELWLWAVGLIVGNVIVWGLMAGPNAADGGSTPVQDVGALFAIVLAVLGTIHALRLRGEVFGAPRGAAAIPAAASPRVHDPAVAQALAARRRRAESLELSIKDPGLARDLRIGRPDLTREYNDGGLVDVNHVPESVLVAHLGLSQDQARVVIEVRDHIGRYSSANELSVLADLPPETLDAIRDRLVVL